MVRCHHVDKAQIGVFSVMDKIGWCLILGSHHISPALGDVNFENRSLVPEAIASNSIALNCIHYTDRGSCYRMHGQRIPYVGMGWDADVRLKLSEFSDAEPRLKLQTRTHLVRLMRNATAGRRAAFGCANRCHDPHIADTQLCKG
tara:strand:+ start:521 stop:955 length:435 start_codon:yes stop_codon:yes gene_type:complete